MRLRFDLRVTSVVIAMTLTAHPSAYPKVLDAIKRDFGPQILVGPDSLIQFPQTSQTLHNIDKTDAKEYATAFCNKEAEFSDLEASMFADMGRLRKTGQNLSKQIDNLSPLSKTSYLKLFELLSPRTTHPNYNLALMKFRYLSLASEPKKGRKSPAFVDTEVRRSLEMRILCEEIRKVRQ